MRHKAIKVRANKLNLTTALVKFGQAKEQYPECEELFRLGQTLVREVQYLHRVISEVRKVFPNTYNDYFDPARLDSALARTQVEDLGEQEN